ncbi:MAG: hypothetical protein Q4F79_11580 [Eubacteriales bacterium]|nr:hypothetical protein [Eubacteriales bacterium]
MSFAGFFAVFPALVLGRLCVRWHDCGIAVVYSGSAGALTAIGLSVLRSPTPAMLPGFLLTLALALLSHDPGAEPLPWQAEWNRCLSHLLPWGTAAALLAGLTHNALPLLPIAGVAAILSRLAWLPIPHTARLGLLFFLTAALGFAASGLLSPWTDWLCGTLCGVCLCTAGFLILPLAKRLYPGLQNPALFCLSVFLTFCYTNSIT